MIRIAIADDHSLIRRGVGKVVEREVDMELVAEYQNAHDLLKHFDGHHCDVLVLDLSLPDCDGLDVLDKILSLWPGVKVLILTVHSEDIYALRALKAGAYGYINKASEAEELVRSIRKIYAGRRYLTDSMAEKLAREYYQESGKAPHEKLTGREFQVFILIGQGMSVQQISELLSITINTVYTYRSRIFEKMGLQSNAQLIRYVIENKLLD